jgi:hypothetical protein
LTFWYNYYKPFVNKVKKKVKKVKTAKKPPRCGGRGKKRDTRRGLMIIFIKTKLQHLAFVEEPAAQCQADAAE